MLHIMIILLLSLSFSFSSVNALHTMINKLLLFTSFNAESAIQGEVVDQTVQHKIAHEHFVVVSIGRRILKQLFIENRYNCCFTTERFLSKTDHQQNNQKQQYHRLWHFSHKCHGFKAQLLLKQNVCWCCFHTVNSCC